MAVTLQGNSAGPEDVLGLRNEGLFIGNTVFLTIKLREILDRERIDVDDPAGERHHVAQRLAMTIAVGHDDRVVGSGERTRPHRLDGVADRAVVKIRHEDGVL